LEVHNYVVPLTSHGKLHEFGPEKPISWAKSALSDFLTVNFTIWSHILSTGEDALTLCYLLYDHMNDYVRDDIHWSHSRILNISSRALELVI
jgi:hypothetical protein